MKKLLERIDKLKQNKPLRIITGIVKGIMYLVLVLLLIVILVQKFSNNDTTICGVRIFTVVTGSMKPEYQVGDIIITKTATAEEIKIGDNVTYLGNKGELNDMVITHQVIKKREENGKTYFTTKGVANQAEDPEIEYSQVYGKVIRKVVTLSYISRLMTNMTYYYIIFTIVGLYASFQLVRAIFKTAEEELDEEDQEDETREETKK